MNILILTAYIMAAETSYNVYVTSGVDVKAKNYCETVELVENFDLQKSYAVDNVEAIVWGELTSCMYHVNYIPILIEKKSDRHVWSADIKNLIKNQE